MDKFFRERHVKQFFSFLVTFLTMLQIMSSGFAEEDSNAENYAEIVLGETVTTHNLTYSANSFSWQPETRNGVCGRRSRYYENGDGGLLLNLNDKFIYNLPNGTPVDITVKYFDDDMGKISIAYDSNNPMANWNWDPNNDIWQKIDDIKNVTGIGDSLFEKIKDQITV